MNSLFLPFNIAIFSILTIISILLYFILIPYYKIKFYQDQGGYIDFHPFSTPFMRNQRQFKKTKDFFFHDKRIIKQFPNTRFIVSNIVASPMITLVDPSLRKDFYSKSEFYHKSHFILMLDKLLGKGLLFSEGNMWKRQRKLISSTFHFEFIKLMIPLIINTTQEFFNEIDRRSLKDVNMLEEFQKITGEIVGRIFFGKMLNKHEMNGKPLTVALANLANDIIMANRILLRFLLPENLFVKLPNNNKILKEIVKLRKICMEIIDERKEKLANQAKFETCTPIPGENNLLDIMLSISGNEDAITDEEIIENFISLFLAGTDTTGHLLAIMIYNLSQHPEYVQQAMEEIEKIYKPNKDTGTLSTEVLNKMVFIEMLIKETLRYNGPIVAVFFRDALVDHMIGDIKVKKGTKILASLVINNFNPKYYDEPEKFNPMRWSEENVKKIDPFVFLPFSAGARNCIGQHLAKLETKIILSEFLLRYNYNIADDYIHLMIHRFLYEPYNDLKVNLQLI